MIAVRGNELTIIFNIAIFQSDVFVDSRLDTKIFYISRDSTELLFGFFNVQIIFVDFII